MRLLDENLLKYAEQHTTPESEVLQHLNRETNAKVMLPQMLSGHLQGQVLAMFSKMMQPNSILEVGTYTGYSAICMAAGLSKDGRLHTIDVNEELEDIAREHWQKAGVADKIELHIGNALEIIPTLNETWDMVFIDADKANYVNYYKMVFDRVKQGGFIIADNVLWSGRVAEPEPDKDTRAIMEYNDLVQQDGRVENVLMPIRDGLMVARKI